MRGPQAAEEEEYDPHLHRELEKPTTDFESLIHILKGCLGTGILAMPQAYMYAGMINGIISTLVISALCTYCLHVLIKSQYVLCKKFQIALLTYPESMKIGLEVGPPFLKPLAPAAPHITNFFLVFNQLGVCCVYVVFVAVNIKDVVDHYAAPLNLAKEIIIACLFLPFLLIMTLKDLKILAPFSVVANGLTIITFAVVAYYLSGDLKNFSDLPAVGTLFEYPLFVGTALFSLQSVGVIIAVENNMKQPKHFGGTFGILNIGVVIVTVIYVIVTTIGYWRYGDEIKDSITLNFPLEDILAQVIKLLYSVAIYISYGLQGFVAVYILWNDYISKVVTSRFLLWHYVLRFSCVLLTFILAATVPLLGYFLSLVGVVSYTALTFIFPATLEICCHWPDEMGRLKYRLIKDIILIILGIVGLTSGAYSNLHSIVIELSNREF